jgi:hypothetical protein
MIKLPYTLLQRVLPAPDIHYRERLCGWLLPAILRVSEKNSSRQFGE